MSYETLITLLVNGVVGLGVFAINSQIKSVREILTVRIDQHEKRMDRIEDDIKERSHV